MRKQFSTGTVLKPAAEDGLRYGAADWSISGLQTVRIWLDVPSD
jgi:hypothetical protein